MNILVLTSTYYPYVSIGGPVFTNHNLYNILKLRDNILVITTTYGNNYGAKILSSNKNFKIIYCNNLFNFQFSFKYIYIMIKNIINARYIHAHGPYSFFIFPLLIANIFYRKNIYLFLHGTALSKNINIYRLDKFIFFILIKFLSFSKVNLIYNSNYEYLNSIDLIKSLKFKIIPHTLPIPNFKYKKNHVNRVVFVGRITPIKRVDILIDAINYINSFRINNLHLDIIGDGDTGYINYLKAKGGGNINFTGQLNGDDKNSAILNSDFLILPSYRENFGNVVIEALSLGIPALVTDESPWRILNITNSGGTFDGSLYDLIFQIINIYNKDYSSLSNNARSVFLEYFSNEKIYEYYK